MRKNYLQDRVERICGDLSRRLFPDDSIAESIAVLQREDAGWYLRRAAVEIGDNSHATGFPTPPASA